MRTVAYLTLAACLATLPFVGTAEAQYGSPAYDQLEPYCRALREQMADKGVQEGGSYRDPGSNDIDELRDHPECRQFRDETQGTVYGAPWLPSHGECKRTVGLKFCYGVNNYGCDLFLSTPFTAQFCFEGLYPYN